MTASWTMEWFGFYKFQLVFSSVSLDCIRSGTRLGDFIQEKSQITIQKGEKFQSYLI